MRALRPLLLWPVIGVLTAAFGLPAMLAAFLPPRGDWFTRFARGWARSILRVAGIRVRVLHAERLEPTASSVVVANHESFADILVLLASLPMQVRFLAKRSIFRVPILGWGIAAAGFVPVDRGEHSKGAAAVEAALARLRDGRSVVVFPEETRTRDGSLLPFKKGAALLAIRSGLPILPVGLAGSRRILPRESLRMAPGLVVASVGEPIGTSGRSVADRAAVTAIVRAAVESLREESARELEAAGAAGRR
jgi:1-acyl-sn-glycerol-3-phosphate acyltransferase